MKLFTKQQHAQLIKNGLPENEGNDHKPVVKWFTPDAGCTWLITELRGDIAFGLCDLGLGFPELGCVLVSEILAVRGMLKLPVERDLCFDAKHPISVYARAASNAGRIIEASGELDKFVK